jgi:regulatory protein
MRKISTQRAREQRSTPDQVRRKTFERAIKLLSARPRSVAELREALLRSANKTLVDTVIDRLREYGYLDDEKFALSYASLKVKQRPIGRRRLERDLKLRKIAHETAVEVLEQVYAETSEEELIERAIEKRIRVRGRPRNRLEAKNLFDHLIRQGFSLELATERVRDVMAFDEH